MVHQERRDPMKKWLLLVLLCLLTVSVVSAEPFLTAQGPIMERIGATRVIVVNEITIIVEPSTPITDSAGRTLNFRHLKPGRWVSVEIEPDEASGMVAKRIILISKK